MSDNISLHTLQKDSLHKEQDHDHVRTPENIALLNVAVIGLGYVGLPLAVSLSKHFKVVGFDIDTVRTSQLNEGFDRTGEIDSEVLKARLSQNTAHTQATEYTQNTDREKDKLAKLTITHELFDLTQQDIYIVTVPTPVTEDNQPDLRPLEKASKMLGNIIKKGAIVVFESTVYPGVTETFCGPILEEASGLKSGEDFFLGYSPERINPGDKEHTVDKITKVVSAQTAAVAEVLAAVYGAVNNGNIFVAKNIKTAEAAKVIENAQRDINIAFINEIAAIVGKLGLSIYDVLEAAKTKWNFLNFQPGLVGGHCIGVDPYYLAYCSRTLAHEPEMILAGRRTNENMGPLIANRINALLSKQSRILILGLTFKENIPDLRNTKVIDVINALKDLGHTVEVHDCEAEADEALAHLGIALLKSFEELPPYDCLVGAVSHDAYKAMNMQTFQKLLRPRGLVADIKNMWRTITFSDNIRYWSL